MVELGDREGIEQLFVEVESRIRRYCVDNLEHSWGDLYQSVMRHFDDGKSSAEMADWWEMSARIGHGTSNT